MILQKSNDIEQLKYFKNLIDNSLNDVKVPKMRDKEINKIIDNNKVVNANNQILTKDTSQVALTSTHPPVEKDEINPPLASTEKKEEIMPKEKKKFKSFGERDDIPIILDNIKENDSLFVDDRNLYTLAKSANGSTDSMDFIQSNSSPTYNRENRKHENQNQSNNQIIQANPVSPPNRLLSSISAVNGVGVSSKRPNYESIDSNSNPETIFNKKMIEKLIKNEVNSYIKESSKQLVITNTNSFFIKNSCSTSINTNVNTTAFTKMRPIKPQKKALLQDLNEGSGSTPHKLPINVPIGSRFSLGENNTDKILDATNENNMSISKSIFKKKINI